MASPQIIGNTVTENWSLFCGGGIFLQFSSDVYFERCLVYSNESEYGGGIYIGTSPGAEIVNCTVADNYGSEWAGGFYTATFSYPEVLNTIVYGNTAGTLYPNMFTSGDDSFRVSYSDIEGGWTGAGNIDGNPLFSDAGSGDYSLSWLNYPLPDSTRSPCIDAGNPEQVYNDPDGTRNDLGAFYFEQTVGRIDDLVISASGNDIILTWNGVLGAIQYSVYFSEAPYFYPTGAPDTVIYAPDTCLVIDSAILGNSKFFRIISGN